MYCARTRYGLVIPWQTKSGRPKMPRSGFLRATYADFASQYCAVARVDAGTSKKAETGDHLSDLRTVGGTASSHGRGSRAKAAIGMNNETATSLRMRHNARNQRRAQRVRWIEMLGLMLLVATDEMVASCAVVGVRLLCTTSSIADGKSRQVGM